MRDNVSTQGINILYGGVSEWDDGFTMYKGKIESYILFSHILIPEFVYHVTI